MKKLLICFYGLLFLAAAAGTSVAVPFQVTDSKLDVQWNSGVGYVSYTAYSMSNAVDLGEGGSTVFTFGTVSFPAAWGAGTANLTIVFNNPVFKDPVTDSATFGVKSLGFFSGGNLSFGGPNSFAYTYNDLPGVMTLALFDISGIQWGHSVDIKGRISNSFSAITEPATMFLMGGGLLGLALVSRKKFIK